MSRKVFVRIQLALVQNRVPLGFVVLWLAASTALFTRLAHVSPIEGMMLATCLQKATGAWGTLDQAFTEVVVFGLVASLVVANVTRRYRPEDTARALGAGLRRHVVVIGYTNLGKRVRDIAREIGCPVVVVDPDSASVASLVRDEEAVVIGSGRERAALEAASLAHARVVVVATDDLEEAAVACRIARDLNRECELIVRCADDDVGTVLARTYRARSLSTSRSAGNFVAAQAQKLRVKSAVVLGANNVSARVAEALGRARIPVRVAPATTNVDELRAAGVGSADLIVLCDDDLGENLVRVDRIRDIDKRARIICRAFHEDAAQILTRPPFECTVLSTSRHAAEELVRAGIFRDLGDASACAGIRAEASS
jgi:Trk K+ transport system NAD-binding subunit